MTGLRPFLDVFEEVQGGRRPGETRDAWLGRQYEPQRYQLVAELLARHCPAGASVADIGAWPGTFSVCLQRMGWKVLAVDKAIDRSVAWSPANLCSGEWLRADPQALTFEQLCRQEGVSPIPANIESEPLPFASDSIDAVVLTEVIEHVWKDPLFVLAEINRVLKPATGIMVLSTPNLLALRQRVEFFRGRIDRVIEHPFVSYLKLKRVGHLGHLRMYAPSELLDMLRMMGFSTEVQYQSIAPPPPPDDGGQAASGSAPSAVAKRPAGMPRLLRKFIKTPSGYANAVTATLMEIAERRVPSLRGRIFVVARKVTDANFEVHHQDDLRRLVSNNRLQ